MKDLIKRRGGYWLLQWWRLGAAIFGICTLGFLDGGSWGERVYLDAMTPLKKDKT